MEFQSRNRGSFLFKVEVFDRRKMDTLLFQSRNRGSFLFKSFNVSSVTWIDGFQSRNRGSFLFKV